MDFERIKTAYDLINAPPRRTLLPSGITGVCLVFEPIARVRLGVSSSPYMLRFRNVGDTEAELVGVDAPPGVDVVLPDQRYLRARSLKSAELLGELSPIHLNSEQDDVRLVLRVTLPDGTLHRTEVRIPLERGKPAGLALMRHPVSIHFADRRDLHLEAYRPFEITAPNARKVDLRIERGPATFGPYPQSFPMKRGEAGRFQAAVSMPEGDSYAYRFHVDGQKLLTDEDAEETGHVGGVDSLCSIFSVGRARTQKILFKNAGSMWIEARMEAKHEWLTLSSHRLSLDPGQTVDVQVSVRLEGLDMGTHTGEILVDTGSGDPLNRFQTIPVRLTISAIGPALALAGGTVLFGTVYCGSAAEHEMEIRNAGSGELRGRFVSSQDEYLRCDDFAVAALAKGKLRITVSVPATGVPPGLRSGILEMETNSVLHGREKLRIPVSYNVAGMMFKPEQANLGTVWPGKTETLVVKVYRGDRTTLLGPLEISKRPSWLEAAAAGDGQIVLKANVVDRMDRSLDAALTVKEPKTGLTGVLSVRGQFALPRARADKRIDLGRVRIGEARTVHLPIYNDGQGTLLVKEIVLDQPWLKLVEAEGAEPIPYILEVQVEKQHVGDSRGRQEALVEVITNDPLKPKLEIPLVLKLVD